MTHEHWGDANARCMGVLLDGRAQETGVRRAGTDATILLVLNAHHDVVRFTLPEAAGGDEWVRLVDTNQPDTDDLARFAFGQLAGLTLPAQRPLPDRQPLGPQIDLRLRGGRPAEALGITSHFRAVSGAGQHRFDGLRESRRRTRLHHAAHLRPGHHLGRAAHRRCHDGRAAGHAFQQHIGPALALGREHHDVGRAVPVQQLGVRHGTREADGLGHAERAGLRLELCACRAFADQHEFGFVERLGVLFETAEVCLDRVQTLFVCALQGGVEGVVVEVEVCQMLKLGERKGKIVELVVEQF